MINIEIENFKVNYQEQWKQINYEIPYGDIDLNLFDEIFEAAIKNITGKK